MPRGVAIGVIKLHANLDCLILGVVKSKVTAFFSISASGVPLSSSAAKTHPTKPACVVCRDESVSSVLGFTHVAKIDNSIVVNPSVDVIYDVGPESKMDNPSNSMSKINFVVNLGVKISSCVFCRKGWFARKSSIPLVSFGLPVTAFAVKSDDGALFPYKQTAGWVVMQYRLQKFLTNLRWCHCSFPNALIFTNYNSNSTGESKHA